jgi:hypothetical protein
MSKIVNHNIELYGNELQKVGYNLNAYTKESALWVNIDFIKEDAEDIINREDTIVIKLTYPNTVEIKSWKYVYKDPYFIGEVSPDKIVEILNTIK